MKKLIFSMAVATVFIACDNAANSGSNAQDSLDSIANAKKEKIDSAAEQRKAAIDSITEKKKNALDGVDSLNRKEDSATR